MNGKRLLLIVNPCSGKAKMRTELLRVVEILSGADYEVTVYPTKDKGDATVKVASLTQNEFDVIVVCGGDGTLNETLSGMMLCKEKLLFGRGPTRPPTVHRTVGTDFRAVVTA